ncbi:hypothetical protein OHA72_09845 [Dactylosporangium sp. NBC_01737]|uniref:hypothetical protein n=1 Tax=Dactylosporangium sp. NBC_01737 TaxID=2975959 RepID=UPI002E0F387F|nr:hypothetical protein OHA72_09845 [Dactylosporangium sp. NBC_01737]
MRDSSVLVRDAGPLTVAEPAMNLMPALLAERLGCPVLAVCGQQVPVRALVQQRPTLRRHLGRPVVLGIHSDDPHDAVTRRPRRGGVGGARPAPPGAARPPPPARTGPSTWNWPTARASTSRA